jgi:antitoxin component of MazEF toxin-antitoxin module
MRRKLDEKNIRKIYKHSASYALTIPKEIMDDLNWRKGQKVVVKKRGNSVLISDWKK